MAKRDDSTRDRELGMDRPIDRRDFLNGVAVGAAGLAAGMISGCTHMGGAMMPSQAAPPMPDTYPPARTGLRGSHPGAFETAHSVRDGIFWQNAKTPSDTDRDYDLVVVGAGISGLSAAYFFREARPNARILIVDNHDDFGGHAKRNEFMLGGKLHLLNGGTELIDSPRPYSPVAAGLLNALGIDAVALAKSSVHEEIYEELGPATFFDKETFGADKLVTGGRGDEEEEIDWPAFLAQVPLSDAGKADILRIETGVVDYFPGLSSAQKKDRLSRMSYLDYLSKVVMAGKEALAFYQKITHDEWGVGIDAEPALDCWGFGFPGFQGLKLDPGPTARMGNTAAGYVEGGSPVFHFPDGNATIARALVRRLIPAAMPGNSLESIITARANYAELDREGVPIRLRLNSTAVSVRNTGSPAPSQAVEIIYARGADLFRVRASQCVLAGWNMMIPYICGEMPDAQKQALRELVKVPLVYTSVAIANWRAFKSLGIWRAYCPGSFFSSVRLNWPVDIGDYTSERSPDDPMLLFLVRTPCQPGEVEKEQHRLGRAELLITPFSTFERNIRDQLGRMLGPAGFDPARDITAITVNRWPHGYAYEYNPLFDNFDLPEAQRPHVIGRKPVGRITIANSDLGASAYTDSAIDQARRAVDELLAMS